MTGADVRMADDLDAISQRLRAGDPAAGELFVAARDRL